MKTLVKQIKLGEEHFGSGGRNTPAFHTFFRSFTNKLTKQLRDAGCSNIEFSKGHFYLSGFFKKGDQWWYFSLSDVRSNWGEPSLLYRTAKDNKDFTGGINKYVPVGEYMVKEMKLNN